MNNTNKKYKNICAFTLVEVLIVLTTIGIIFALTALNITGILTDNNISKFKKSYLSLENAVGSLVRSEAIYGTSGGFKDTSKILVKNTGEIFGNEPASKFRDAFRYYTGAVKDNLPCKLYNNAQSKTGCFQTDDGIVWGIPDTDFVRKNTVTLKDFDNYDVAVVPITIYLDYQNNQEFEQSAYVAGVGYDGRIFLSKNLNTIDCKKNKKAPQCNIGKYIKTTTIKTDNADEWGKE